ncbi:MAG: SHOCT-like domain-containing protein [Dictyoglomus turgidum]
MEEEIKKILKLLEEGKITAEDAEKLIEAIEEKRETKRKGIGVLDIGSIVAEAITSAFSMVPTLVASGIRGGTKVDETFDWDFERPLYIEVLAGDVNMSLSEEPKVVVIGEGVFSTNGDLLKIHAGDFNLAIPKLKLVKVNVSAGDLKGKLICNELEIFVKMGDANLEVEADRIQGGVNMGDFEIKLLKSPSLVKLNCHMGDLKIALPENFDGKIDATVSLGDLSFAKKADIIKGDTYIYGAGEKSYMELSCTMGDIKVL